MSQNRAMSAELRETADSQIHILKEVFGIIPWKKGYGRQSGSPRGEMLAREHTVPGFSVYFDY